MAAPIPREPPMTSAFFPFNDSVLIASPSMERAFQNIPAETGGGGGVVVVRAATAGPTSAAHVRTTASRARTGRDHPARRSPGSQLSTDARADTVRFGSRAGVTTFR